MKVHRYVLPILASVSLLWMVALVYGQRVTPKRIDGRAVTAQKSVQPVPKAVPNAPLPDIKKEDFPQPPFHVQVDFTLKLDPDAKALYEGLANAFKGYEVNPPTRLLFFSAMNNPPDYVIKGWGGVLTDVQPNEAGGYTVNLSVCPTVQVAGWGTPTLFYRYTEQYWVDADKNIHYLGSKDLDGRAGMKPMVMILN